MKQVSISEYFEFFQSSGHSFILKQFVILNAQKVEDLIFLVEDDKKPSIGILFGIKNNTLISPFSAPFGGFHYTHENIYYSKIEKFISDLRHFFLDSNFISLRCVLPPTIYGSSFNSKILNACYRNNFNLEAIELTSYIDLLNFEYRFTTRNSREYYNQAKKNGLVFQEVISDDQKKKIIKIIKENRESQNRRMSMSLDDFQRIEELWKVDYLAVFQENSDQMIAGGIFYRFPETDIIYIAVWGDHLEGRPLRAMDFLLFESWSFYKSLGFRYIDLGISTEGRGEPNEGLLRFKETHEAITEPRFVLTIMK